MMDEYIEFEDDVLEYFEETIKKYKFSISSRWPDENNELKDHIIFLENEYCAISLDNFESFPYIDVVFHFFFLKGKSELINIDNDLLIKLLRIDDKFYRNYCLEHIKKYKKDFIKKPRGGFLYAIKSASDLMLKFYDPLLNGEVTYEDYNEFERFIKKHPSS